MPMVVLASSSPQRKALLQQIGVDPLCVAADIDESVHSGESAADYVLRLAREKCQVVLAQYPQALVIGADTAISVGQQILGKAANLHQARETLSLLSDNRHEVLTGVSVATTNEERHLVCCTREDFLPVSGAEIEAYWRSGEPQGKAGCYAIQGMGAIFVEAIHGSYSNVVGLPVHSVAEQLRYFGAAVLE